MKILHVARKPLGETSVALNCTKLGAGALNISATRVSTSDDLNGGAYAKDGKQRWDGAENWRYKREGGAGEFVQPPGRWPSNLILQGDHEEAFGEASRFFKHVGLADDE
jgi:hypothetical protein